MGSALTGISKTSLDSHKSASTVGPSLELRGKVLSGITGCILKSASRQWVVF